MPTTAQVTMEVRAMGVPTMGTRATGAPTMEPQAMGVPTTGTRAVTLITGAPMGVPTATELASGYWSSLSHSLPGCSVRAGDNNSKHQSVVTPCGSSARTGVHRTEPRPVYRGEP
ncbi:MAG: hypothetical protein J07HX64_00253 [halophilic archaeon J07HX64]|nr:MAG: hypothetical protein J07HX64_00253 [halophilic archaeon J07HX64]